MSIRKNAPVCITLFFMLVLYSEFVYLHCIRLIRQDYDGPSGKDAQVQLGVFHVLALTIFYCYGMAHFTSPGTIPDDGWEADRQGQIALGVVERKRNGEARFCKKCLKHKPDRAHHCKVCDMCVLRMDHHCIFLANCIGFHNYKYFFLLVFYTMITLVYIATWMFKSVWWSTRTDVSVHIMISLIFGEVLALFLFVMVSIFFAFHFWLLSKALTTVEFCEKSIGRGGYMSRFSLGLYENLCAALGPVPLLWLVPISIPVGDGLTFQSQRRMSIPSMRTASLVSRGSVAAPAAASAASDAAPPAKPAEAAAGPAADAAAGPAPP